MAKILYGVAGEGFGHSSRSELLGERLVQAGHEVVFAASNKSYRYLKPTFKEQVREVYGLSFYYSDGKVKPLRTVLKNISGFPKGHRVNRQLLGEFAKDYKPDVVISDFEPFSAWWAWRNRVPCVSVDHEHVLTCCELDMDLAHWKERFMARTVTRGYHTFADAYVILNFFRTELRNKNSILVPPVVRDIVREHKPTLDEHVLIYSTDSGKQQCDKIFNAVSQYPAARFIVYGFNKAEEKENCSFRKTSTEGFLRDLASCRAVVATAGFSLLSECLYFKKPMLLMPVHDQYEQILNSLYIEKMGLGRWTKSVNPQTIRSFMEQLDTFSTESRQIEWPDNERYFSILDRTFNTINCPLNLMN